MQLSNRRPPADLRGHYCSFAAKLLIFFVRTIRGRLVKFYNHGTHKKHGIYSAPMPAP